MPLAVDVVNLFTEQSRRPGRLFARLGQEPPSLAAMDLYLIGFNLFLAAGKLKAKVANPLSQRERTVTRRRSAAPCQKHANPL